MKFRGVTNPETTNERIAVAEREIDRAQKRYKHSKQQAAASYLVAAEMLWPVVRDHANPSDRAYWGDKKRLIIAHQLYTHAVGQIANYVTTSDRLTGKQQSITLGELALTFNTQSPDTIHPSYFDEIRPVDTHRYGNVGEYHYARAGLGAATIGHRKWSAHRKQNEPLMPPHGINIPVNAIIDYPAQGQPRLTLTNLLKADSTQITGSQRPLAADYSAAIAATMDDQSSLLGLAVALNPKKYINKTGLFAIGPFDPDKIPVIFIHGLISQPSTWTTPSNHLLADKTIRENYQFFYYFYPTGGTPLISGAQLRRILLDFYQEHDPHAQRQLQRTVLVGHSMGGLLSSVQSRTFDQNLWNRIFHATSSADPKSIRAQAKPLFHPPSLPSVERTVFIATPHRGSKLASNWVGRIGSSLIKIPTTILSLQLSATAEEMTELGRNLINSSGPANSITRLEPDNKALKLLNEQPFNPRVTYHSIIGDRGKKNTPDSSDGVVPYWSSHLDGAASEKIVPGHHEAHLTREAHEELVRILHLHLKAK